MDKSKRDSPAQFEGHLKGDEDKLKFSQFIWLLSDSVASSEKRYIQYAVSDIDSELQKRYEVPSSYIRSGSHSEGLPNFNDADLMVEVPSVELTSNKDDLVKDGNTTFIYLVPSEHTGFVNLYTSSRKGMQKVTHQDLHSTWEADYLPKIPKHRIQRHGPAQMVEYGETSGDYVPCYKAQFWPEMAKGFLQRPRHNGWPNERHLHDIKNLNLGFNTVAISNPLSPSEDEFRMSFSKAENYLIRTWTDIQFQCYFLCKEIQRASCFQDAEGNPLLSSYFFKTTLFWLCENKHWKYWCQTAIVDILLDIIDHIHGFIAKRKFPNYFIPENNMMIHFTDDKCSITKSALTEMKASISHILIHTDISEYIQLLYDHEESYTHQPISTIDDLLTKMIDLKMVLSSEIRKFSLQHAFGQLFADSLYPPFPNICFMIFVINNIPNIVHTRTPGYLTVAIQQLAKRAVGLNLIPFFQAKKFRSIYEQGVSLLSDVELPRLFCETKTSELGALLLFSYLNNDIDKVKQLITTEAIDIGGDIKTFSLLNFPLPIGLSKEHLEPEEDSNHPWLSVLPKCDQNFVKLQNIAWNTSDFTDVLIDPLVLNGYLSSVVLEKDLTMTDDELQYLLNDGYSLNIGGNGAIDTPYLDYINTSFKFLREYMRFKMYEQNSAS